MWILYDSARLWLYYVKMRLTWRLTQLVLVFWPCPYSGVNYSVMLPSQAYQITCESIIACRQSRSCLPAQAQCKLSKQVCQSAICLKLRRRGRRSESHVRDHHPFASRRIASANPGEIPIIIGNQRLSNINRPRQRHPTAVQLVRTSRHAMSSANRFVVYGCMNIPSIANKLDDLLDVRRDLSWRFIIYGDMAWHWYRQQSSPAGRGIPPD